MFNRHSSVQLGELYRWHGNLHFLYVKEIILPKKFFVAKNFLKHQ